MTPHVTVCRQYFSREHSTGDISTHKAVSNWAPGLPKTNQICSNSNDDNDDDDDDDNNNNNNSGANVEPPGVHNLVCRHAPGCAAIHHALNDCIFRALEAAGIPATKEPSGLVRSDGKRPVSCSLISWCSGKSLTWDVTAACTVADSYLQASSREPHYVSELSATQKEAKYSMLTGSYIFQPLVFESHATAISFIKELGHRISQRSDDDREIQFPFRRLSVIMLRYNDVLYGESYLAASEDPDI